MQKRTIANHRVFPIGLGAMPLSITGRPSLSDAVRVITTFIELGGNLIDTADVYGLDDRDRGHNEKLIHQVLKQVGANHEVVIATKGGATRPGGGWCLRGGGHPKKLRDACEASLRHLGISAHELYYLHGPDPAVPLEDSLGELIKLKDEGKIKNIGIANVNLEQLTLAMKIVTIKMVQNRCNLFCKQDLSNGVVSLCETNHITYVPYCPLGGWADHAKLASSPHFDYFTQKYAVSSYEIFLAWLINQSDHILPIPGMDRVEQVAINFHSLTLQIEPQDLLKLNEFPDLYTPAHVDP